MNHNDLMKKVAAKIDLKPQETAILWETAQQLIGQALAERDKVRIKNFGAFVIVKHKSRTVPDPRERTKKLVIFDQYLPKFRPSEELKKRIKHSQPHEIEGLESPIEKAELSETVEASIAAPELSKKTAREEKEQPIARQADPLEASIEASLAEAGQEKESSQEHDEEENRQVAKAVQSTEKPSDKSKEKEPMSLGKLKTMRGSATKVVTELLERAVNDKASDVHIEPSEELIIVRFRIDGLLQPITSLPKPLHNSIVSRLKILSSLKIDETRLPQDGRFRIVVKNQPIDFRVSTLPTVNGEKIVLRILDKSVGILSFSELGLAESNLAKLEENMTKSHGMILVTGPTGSGKTTTLYAVIGQMMQTTNNIVTLEDPVEYRIPYINQSQVNASIGYDFASGLRSIVRQDPDVILIGEIRDSETATMAIHSALTGHVVLSTLHTNDAAGAIPRLIDMGIEPFLISSSTNAVVAQRLVRRICQECKQPFKVPREALEETRADLEVIAKQTKTAPEITFYEGKGCNHCHHSGYSGRFGIFEVLPMTESIKQLTLKRAAGNEITTEAINGGMLTLRQDGIIKALKGETTLEEVWRVTKD